jgi:hypothetical protein
MLSDLDQTDDLFIFIKNSLINFYIFDPDGSKISNVMDIIIKLKINLMLNCCDLDKKSDLISELEYQIENFENYIYKKKFLDTPLKVYKYRIEFIDQINYKIDYKIKLLI